jgi:hypothetical protein
MKLADLRRLTIRKQLKIHFKLRNGAECIVNEHGVALAPALRSVPDFNFEDELAAAGEFLVEPAAQGQARKLTRAEMTAMAADSPAAAHPHEHDDE